MQQLPGPMMTLQGAIKPLVGDGERLLHRLYRYLCWSHEAAFDSQGSSNAPPCTIYDLFAVCNHYGRGLNYGHYTASVFCTVPFVPRSVESLLFFRVCAYFFAVPSGVLWLHRCATSRHWTTMSTLPPTNQPQMWTTGRGSPATTTSCAA